MREINQFKGYWFTPNEPDKKVAGTFHFIPNKKLKLELIGGFDTPMEYIKSFADDTQKNESIIWGIDQNAQKITLLNCYKYGSLNFSSEFPMTNYNAQYAIIGLHIDSWENEAFFKLTVELPLLTEWVNFRRVHFSMPFSNEEKRWLGFDIKFRMDDFDNISLKLDENLTLLFPHNCTLPQPNSFDRNIKEFYTLEIQSGTEINFWKLLVEAKKFSKFLTLACRSQIDFIKLTLYSKHHYQALSNDQIHYRPIQLLYKQPELTTKDDAQKNGAFLFDYQQIEEQFPTIIRKWYSFDASMTPILGHLIDSINTRVTFRSVDFLVVCQALEGFHRRFNGNNGKFILKNRIYELVNEFSYIKEVSNIPVSITVNSRNYYSHLYLQDQREIYQGYELYNLTKMLRTLLICCVLKFIGFSDDSIKNIMDK